MAAAILPACRRGREVTPPQTYPVNGKVVVSNGKIPVGYLLQFESGDPKTMAEGLIESDGTFKLVTRYEGVVCEGAVEGEYRVTIVAPMSPGASFSGTKRLPKPIRIKAEPNEVTLALDTL
ncbi:MAG: hypothetical protein JXM70_21630 [Pirellulales bacterium]|nr:hypothetical protein [Pirellulales bacterium]